MMAIGSKHFWRGFAEGIQVAFVFTVIIALIAAVLAWQTVLPSIGFLWLVGAL